MKKYKLICYMRIDTEDSPLMDLTEAEEEKEQSERFFPENRYEIQEVEDDA
jgi:hypothetical protein